MKSKSDYLDVVFIDNEVSDRALKTSYSNKQSLYGITKSQFLALVAKQNGKCAGCGDDATGMEHTLHVDHDHYTNEIRGLLCNMCNTALGWLDDDPERAEKLAAYLRHNGTGMFVPKSR